MFNAINAKVSQIKVITKVELTIVKKRLFHK